MSFRRRMILLAAGAVAAAVVLASVVVYLVTRNELRGQIDDSLRQTASSALILSGPRAATLVKYEREGRRIEAESRQVTLVGPKGATIVTPPAARGFSAHAPSANGVLSVTPGNGFSSGGAAVSVPHGGPNTELPGPGSAFSTQVGQPNVIFRKKRTGGHETGTAKLVLTQHTSGGPLAYAQFYESGGQVLKSDQSGLLLPITPATHAVAAGRRGSFFSNATVAGTPVRILTEAVIATNPATGARMRGVLQAALSTTDTNTTLANLRLVLALVCLGGVVLAAALGLLVSRAALVPVRRLTRAAERVARTQNLGHRITASEQDELGRLAGSFNTMLAALERSRLAQRQLISDASHELRTPLASIQANLDALSLGGRLPAPDRARALAAAQAQLGELAVLVGDLVDLSKTEVDRIELEDVRLDLAAAEAVQRARLHAPQCRFELTAEPCLVRAAPARLDRAISNLLENAVKWGPSDGPVEVDVRGGALTVRDHGPGIDPEDRPRVFDRFYRAPAARSRPGSGLGLAIVRQMAESHGGAVHATNDSGGGACLTLELEALQMSDDERAGVAVWAASELQEPPRPL